MLSSSLLRGPWAVLACAVLLLFCSTASVSAQQEEHYLYFSSDTSSLYNLAVTQRHSLENHVTIPDGVSADYRKSYKHIIGRSARENYWRIRRTALLDSVAAPYASSKATTSYVYPAKSGYVMILAGQNEKKSLEMKLVKLNK